MRWKVIAAGQSLVMLAGGADVSTAALKVVCVAPSGVCTITDADLPPGELQATTASCAVTRCRYGARATSFRAAGAPPASVAQAPAPVASAGAIRATAGAL